MNTPLLTSARKLAIIAEAELVPHRIRGKISVQPCCQKAVLMVFALYEGLPVSRPGIEARTGLCRDTIRNCVVALEARGLIRAAGFVRQKYRQYTINWDALAAVATRDPIAKPEPSAEIKSQRSRLGHNTRKARNLLAGCRYLTTEAA